MVHLHTPKDIIWENGILHRYETIREKSVHSTTLVDTFCSIHAHVWSKRWGSIWFFISIWINWGAPALLLLFMSLWYDIHRVTSASGWNNNNINHYCLMQSRSRRQYITILISCDFHSYDAEESSSCDHRSCYLFFFFLSIPL